MVTAAVTDYNWQVERTQGGTGRERDLTWAGEHSLQCTDDVLWNYRAVHLKSV